MSELDHIFFRGVEVPTATGRRGCLPVPTEPGNPLEFDGSPAKAHPYVQLDPFLNWILCRSGLDGGLFQGAALMRRLPACLRALRVPSTAVAKELVERTPSLLPRVLDALLIGVSAFFRDPPVFRCLREEILPGLAAAGGRQLRIYSAGCADGEEIYSVAILLAELGLLGRSDLVGVDCRPGAVEQARLGRYPHEQLKNVEPGVRARYFAEGPGGSWQVAPALRNRVRWERANILTYREDKPWDLILCCNVAIYLDFQAASLLWGHLSSGLRPGGVLVTGSACKPGGPRAALQRVARCVYRRKSSA